MLSSYGKSNEIISYETLQKATGYKTPAGVANCLFKNKIRFAIGINGQPFTSIGALELGIGAISDAEAVAKEDDVCGIVQDL